MNIFPLDLGVMLLEERGASVLGGRQRPSGLISNPLRIRRPARRVIMLNTR